MPPQSAAERNRMKAFVEQTSNRLTASPHKNRRGDQSPDTAFTENLESLNIIQVNNPNTKAQDDVFDENTRPPSAQSVDGRSAHNERLFNGSELSEGFMRSGRSTPSETSRSVPARFMPKGVSRQESRNPSRLAHGGAYSLPAVTVGSDFRMTMTEPQQNNIADMKDGFSAAGITHTNARWSQSPARNSHKHHHHHHHHNHHNAPPKAYRRREQLTAAPQVEEENRGRTQSRAKFDVPSPAFTESDDGPRPVHEDEHVQTTPRGKQLPMRNRVHHGQSPVTQPGGRKRRRKSLDYDDQALNTMEYRALLEQPFDFDPATAMTLGNTIGHNGDDDQRLAQMRHMGSAEQQRFFGDMSVDEWEIAGNWFSEQFTGIMRKLTAARQSKRHIVDSFEQEAAAREAEVRRRSNKIDEKLQKMREDGMKVVGGRS
ncbi:hypothetical protein LLEC1_07880 [Akanthomyces lecanii]|uniref:Extracellular mutant protein 11 C-terminal domain-containing protein n=1 Tax=Cordyceps confragosa TaxID=2714763 RepID=A0A179ID61_CORDF|nr:hypothetical protein LLEC1_07880 [Akanthomyces lecanii]